MQFQSSKKFTLGVEQELQLIDPVTRDLKACSIELLASLGEQDRIVAEIFQSMIEVRTGICKDAHEVLSDLVSSHKKVYNIAQNLGAKVASSGSHPFARYEDRRIFPSPRYANLIDRNQWIARRLMIFGLHIHIGMADGEMAIRMTNRLQRFLPFLLSLSASSPFWTGQDTGLYSSRITAFEAIPTGGHPYIVKSWQEFENLEKKLTRSHAITSLKDIWWDIRPNPEYGTIEIRICDAPHRLEQVAALAALIHMLVQYLETAPEHDLDTVEDWWVRENKWRASRYGLLADFIISREGDVQSAYETWHILKKLLNPFVELHQYQDSMNVIDGFFKDGNCAEFQRKIFTQTKDLTSVVDAIVAEHETSLRLFS